MDLILIRHPAPAIDPGVCYGRTDVPLAGDAQESARLLAARLAALDAPSPDHFATSPLRRCADVAQELARHLGCDCRPDSRLQEIDFGAWEGQRWDAIDRAALDAWAADLRYARMHGGENVAQFETRLGAWIESWSEARAQACASACLKPPSSVLALTHAGVMRTMASLLLDEAFETTLKWPLEMGALVWLRRNACTAANDICSGWRVLHWNV